MGQAVSPTLGKHDPASAHSRRRAVLELSIPYGLILLVIWTPRPWQKWLWWVAAVAIVAIFWMSFDRMMTLGLRTAGFFRALWVAGAALLLAAIAVLIAIQLHTLHLPPGGPVEFIKNYWAYALWACVQQLLLQGFFLPRCLELLKGRTSAALLAGFLFALAHLPNPILTPITLLWGFTACMLFLRYRNLYPLAIAHAIVGVAIAVTIPGHVDHNMRVGLGYLTYGHRAQNPSRLLRPQLTKPQLTKP
ncbi:MAG: CPBP family intramembrane glutamic endopeptidase [Terracidiphilus sp.]